MKILSRICVNSVAVFEIFHVQISFQFQVLAFLCFGRSFNCRKIRLHRDRMTQSTEQGEAQ